MVMVSKFVRQKLMKIMKSFPDIRLNNRKQLKKISDIRYVLVVLMRVCVSECGDTRQWQTFQ